MKLKHVLLTVAASFAMGLGALALVRGVEVKEAKADPVLTRLYLDMSLRNEAMTDGNNWTSSNATFKVHTWNGTADNYTDAVKASANYWYADVDMTNVQGYRFVRYGSDGTSLWNKGKWTSDLTVNYFVPSAWTGGGTGGDAGDSDGTWSNYPTSGWKLLGHTGGVWEEDADVSKDIATVQFDNDGLQIVSKAVTLEANVVFKFNNGETWWGFEKLATYGGQSAREKGDVITTGEGDANIKVVTAGTYEVYISPKNGNVWMQLDSTSEATAFATTFLSETGKVCSTGTTSDNHGSALAAIWNANDQDEVAQLEELWDGLTAGARGAFAAGTANETLIDAKARYIHIMGRYSEVLNEFESGPSYSSGVFMTLGSVQNNHVALIAVISAGVTICGLALVLSLKKRKHQ